MMAFRFVSSFKKSQSVEQEICKESRKWHWTANGTEEFVGYL